MCPRLVTHQELDAAHRFETDSGIHLLTSPLTLGRARAALEAADDRDDVFVVLLRALRTVADQSIVFAVKRDRVVGHLSLRGDRLDSDDIATVDLPLDGVVAFVDAVRSGAPATARIGSDDVEVERALGRVVGRNRTASLLLPVAVNGRVVAIAVGVRDGEDMPVEAVAEVAPLGQPAGEAVGRAILQAKRNRPIPRLATRPPSEAPVEGTVGQLDALYLAHRKEGRYVDCVETLLALAEAEPERAVDSLMDAGAILEEHLADPDGAVSVYDAVRGLEPAHVGACERLTVLYRGLERYDDLVDVLLERADGCSDVHDRVALLVEAAEVYRDGAGNHDAAFLIMTTAVGLAPQSELALEGLYGVAESTGRWGEVSSTLAEAATRMASSDCDAACRLWLRSSLVHRDKLGDLEAALADARRAVQLDRAHPDALETVADLLRDTENWGELAGVTMALAERETDADARVELTLVAADLYETRLDSPADAMRTYRAAMIDDPTCMLALVSLERLYREAEQWGAYADVLNRLADLRSDDLAEVVRIKLAMADLYVGPLDDKARAIELCNEVADLDPGNNDALSRLETLYEESGDAEQYLDVLERQMDTSETKERRAGVYARLASVWEKDYARPDRAAACLEKFIAQGDPDRDQFRRLIKLYREDKQWVSVLDTYRSYLDHVDEPTARVDILVSMAEVAETEVGDSDQTIELLRDVLDIDPDEPRALASLARLYEECSDWASAVEMLERSRAAALEIEERANLACRIGTLFGQRLGDAARAEICLQDALSENPNCDEAVDELCRLYESRSEWQRAADILTAAGDAARVPADRARRHFAAASLYTEHLDDSDRALASFETVLEAEPGHAGATAGLADIYFQRERWQELLPLLDQLLQEQAGPAGRASRERGELCFRAGRCAEVLGDAARAETLYTDALAINGGDERARVARADLRFADENWRGASEDYRALLVRGDASDGELARIYFRLGLVHRATRESRKALEMLERASASDELRERVLVEMAEIQVEMRDWDAVIATKRLLLADASDDAKGVLLREIGDIYCERSDNPHKGLAAYRDALELSPGDHQVLQKLLDAYSEAGKWTQALDIIEKFIALESDPVRSGSYYQAAGAIARTKLKDAERALDYFDAALDSFFAEREAMPEQRFARALEAFREMDEILTEQKAWTRQERAYRRMIKRTRPEDKALLGALWHALGEIYRTRLQRYLEALHAFSIAHSFDPSDGRRGVIIGELCHLVGPENRDTAIAEATKLASVDPERPEPYRALFQLYRDAGALDRAWCAASALVVLEKADVNEMAFFKHHRAAAMRAASRSLSSDAWLAIAHPDESRYISAIFAAVNDAIASLVTRPHDAYGLKKKDAIDLDRDQSKAGSIVQYAVKVLGVSRPDVFVQPDEPGGLLVANCSRRNAVAPALVLRRDLAQASERELLFTAGYTLSMLRPERYLKLALQTTADLETGFATALAVADPNLPVPEDKASYVRGMADKVAKRIEPRKLEQLRQVVARLLESHASVEVASWIHGAEATAHRAGLLVCGDLYAAARIVADEPTVVGGPTAREKVRRLMAFGVSETYFEARRQLGVCVPSDG